MGTSNIDVTLLAPQTRNLASEWKVCDVTDSDHNVVSFELNLRDRAPRGPEAYRFNTRKADWVTFSQSLCVAKQIIDVSTIDTQACTIVNALQIAAKKSIPRLKRLSGYTGKQPWWTSELTSLRVELARIRRLGLHRTNRPEYNAARNNYLKTIRKAKDTAWRAFAEQINSNPWGKAFSWAKRGSKARTVPSTMTRGDGTSTSTISETADLLLGSFFPGETEPCELKREGPLEVYPNEIDGQRVKAAIWRMSPLKAPGSDGISAAILRKAWPIIGDDITRLFDRCIREANFPKEWRTAKLVVIPKPGKKDMSNPKSYRPISLLPTLGKALETIMIQDLERETNLNGFANQHGFFPGKSTITAISQMYEGVDTTSCRFVFGIFLDITGAFDHVRWAPILTRLTEMGASHRTIRLILSYLEDRKVNFELEGANFQRTLERGCPQESQLGPTLWKVAMTSIGEIKMDPTANVILYANDIALIVGAARPATAFRRAEGYLEELKTWAGKYGLQFSPGKSQLMSIKGGLKPHYTVKFGTSANDPEIQASETVKYLYSTPGKAIGST